MKYPLPFFKRRTKKPTSPPGLSPPTQSPGKSKKLVGQLSVLSGSVCVSECVRSSVQLPHCLVLVLASVVVS